MRIIFEKFKNGVLFNVKMKKLLLLLVGIVILSSLVNACECTGSVPTKDAYDMATSVFLGKVVDIDKSAIMLGNAGEVKYTFDVLNVWKGENANLIEVYSGFDSASCGYEFKLDEEYLVYTYESEGKLLTSICENTRLLSEASDEVNELNKLAEYRSIDNNSPGWKNSNLVIYAIIFILALVFVKKLCIKDKEK